jgi:hypothetical protein
MLAVGFLFDISGKTLLEYRDVTPELDAHTPLSVFSHPDGCWFRSATPGHDVPHRSGLRVEDACCMLSVRCKL